MVDRLLDRAAKRRILADRTSPSTRAALRTLYATYRAASDRGDALPSVWETGFRVFSESDEDGILLFLLASLGLGTQRFVDIGAGDGVTASNCANLAFNFSFEGLFVEADGSSIARGKAAYGAHPDTQSYPPKFVEAFVTRSSIDDVTGAGFEGDVDVLSIDIDGNDYWIWEAITCIRPRIVIIETHPELGLRDHVSPYRDDFDWRRAPAGEPLGASPAAMTRLAERLGYRLVGGNRLGFNTIYVRDGLGDARIPTIGVEDLFRYDRSGRLDTPGPPP